MLWVKALHLIFMVTWFAGLFYLPRLYVYHAMSDDSTSNERFKVMERKLFYGIMTPGMILTLIFGIWLLIDYAWAAWGNALWLQVKLGLIVVTVIYHFICLKYLLAFKHDRNEKSHVFYRWFNEFPVLILIAVIFLAVLKPL